MRTFIILSAILMALATLSGCATRGEVELRDANPHAYDATRGSRSPDTGDNDGNGDE